MKWIRHPLIRLSASRAAVLWLLLAAAVPAHADRLADARADLAQYTSHKTRWDGPTSGPVAVPGKRIAVIAADLDNGGVMGVAEGLREAARIIGWQVMLFDGHGSARGRAIALGRALDIKADGIVIDGFDVNEQRPALALAARAHIPVVSWHGAPGVGPVPGTSIFANVSTTVRDVARAAAEWVLVDGKGHPGVVIFTDSSFSIAMSKARRMAEIIDADGGKVLSVEDVPIAEAAGRIPTLTHLLLHMYGPAWTHSLAINDRYFRYTGPALAAEGVAGTAPPIAVAAGDGSPQAYARVRDGRYQAVTVAEPLSLQGWQLVDELNRAFAGRPWSGYVAPLQVVTRANIDRDGGRDNHFDPDNHYRARYRAIWGR